MLNRILSAPNAEPYRSRAIVENDIHIDDDGYIQFAADDVDNPKNWTKSRRWYITFVAVLMVVNTAFASSGPSGCLEGIAQELHVSTEASGLVVTLFLLGYCTGPLLWAPLSEYYGRRWIFYLTFTAYFAFNFLCAFTPNFAGLLIGRLLTGTFASASQSNTPGVLADLWDPIERGNAIAIFTAMTFAGPALGPLTAGFLELTENWRWTFYVFIWMAFATLIFMVTLPETLPSRRLTNKALRTRQARIPGFENVRSPSEGHSLAAIFKVALSRPWKILFDPIAFLVAIYMSIVYMLLYMLFSIYPFVFQGKRGWNSGVGQLPLLGVVVGACIGGVIVYLNSRQDKKRLLNGYKSRPEDRLPLAMFGGVLFPVTMFWFAWSAEYNEVPWIVPTLAGVFLSTSIMSIFVGFLNYLTDSYLVYAASAMAGNVVVRSACGAAAPLFTSYMFEQMGVGGAGSLVGGVACLLAPIPFVFYRYGQRIREKSKFAPTTPQVCKDEETPDTDKEKRPQ